MVCIFTMAKKNDSASPPPERIRVGISSCLLGDTVRYDGGHKHNRYITKILSGFFEFVPACPEVAIGMGIPRPPIRLVGDPQSPRAVGIKDPTWDLTAELDAYAGASVEKARLLSGYIFKRGSPSCGMASVKVFGSKGTRTAGGTGIFARRLMGEIPLMPAEEEARLTDPVLRENFIARVYVYRRWQVLAAVGVTPARLVEFHTRHEMLIRSHGEVAYAHLDRLAADAGAKEINGLAGEYAAILMKALSRPATRKQHGNVLSQLAGYLKRDIDPGGKAELVRLINEYRLGHVPLVAPITMLRHHFQRSPDPYVGHQVYLEPYPEALQLRSFI
jgi:uncharacterized protein YbgA (DUF1722 family)/uncharacterized protein YbbK (DUF523 family)